jgi:hypothetical protein
MPVPSMATPDGSPPVSSESSEVQQGEVIARRWPHWFRKGGILTPDGDEDLMITAERERSWTGMWQG